MTPSRPQVDLIKFKGLDLTSHRPVTSVYFKRLCSLRLNESVICFVRHVFICNIIFNHRACHQNRYWVSATVSVETRAWDSAPGSSTAECVSSVSAKVSAMAETNKIGFGESLDYTLHYYLGYVNSLARDQWEYLFNEVAHLGTPLWVEYSRISSRTTAIFTIC